jgi:hypothetical protein
MKRLLFLFFILSHLLLAQTSDLSVQISDIAASSANKEMTLQLTAAASLQSGLLIQLPADIKMIPLAIEINQNNPALLNSDQPSGSDVVVNWELVPEGVAFIFATGQLLAGDQLRIRLALTLLSGEIRAGTSVEIHAVQTSPSGIQTSDEVISSANLPLSTNE